MKYKMKKDIKIIYPTPEDLRYMQLNMLENLIEFDRICRKYNIKYSIDGGTFLGAIRHKGFIPWDCDIDVVIMREDYEKFFEICKTELDTKRFFLQDYKTDKYYRWGYARLLRNETIFLRAGHEHLKSKNGIFIDIFTMDSVPDNKISRNIHKFSCFIIRKALWSKVGQRVHPNPIMRGIYKIVSLIPKKVIFNIRNMIADICNRNKNTELIRHMCSPHPKQYSYGFPRKLFDNLSEYEFEGHKFLGFSEYDWYLKSIYNDYMKLPSEEERKDHIPCSQYSYIK